MHVGEHILASQQGLEQAAFIQPHQLQVLFLTGDGIPIGPQFHHGAVLFPVHHVVHQLWRNILREFYKPVCRLQQGIQCLLISGICVHFKHAKHAFMTHIPQSQRMLAAFEPVQRFFRVRKHPGVLMFSLTFCDLDDHIVRPRFEEHIARCVDVACGAQVMAGDPAA